MVQTSDIVLRVLSPLNLEELNALGNGILTTRILVDAPDEDSCYSSEYDGLYIVLGRSFFRNYYPDTIEIKDEDKVFKEIGILAYGLFFHELGHLLYTYFNALNDFTFTDSVKKFLGASTNIMEDPTQEDLFIKQYPHKKEPILFLREKTFSKVSPHLEHLCSDAPLHPDTFLSFLLAKCRGQELPPYSFYEKHKKFIDKSITICDLEADGRERAYKQIAFGQEILRLLSDPEAEPDMSKVEKGEVSPDTTEPQETPGSESQEIYDLVDSMGDIESGMHHSSGKYEASDIDTPLKPIEPTLEDIKAIASHKKANTFNRPHVEYHLNKYTSFKSPQHVDVYEKTYNKYKDITQATINVFRKEIAMNTGGVARHQLAGKINVRSIYERGVWKIWDKKILPKPLPNSVYIIIIDCSGSMGADKSKIAGSAALVICEALNAIHLPFEVYAFTQNFYYKKEAITICMKSLKDDWKQIKTNLCMFLERISVKEVNGFCDNTDEININYIGEKIKPYPYDEKHLIVLSDGATCGSASDLRDVVNKLEREGISTLGIGMLDDNVKDIYKNNVVLKNTTQLETLPKILIDYLKKSIFK